MNSREFDDIIKQSAQQREADVPGDIWENIAREKKRKRIPFFWFIFMFLFLGGSIATWNMYNRNVHDTDANTKKKTDERNNTADKNETTVKNTISNISSDTLGNAVTKDHSINAIVPFSTDKKLINGKNISVKVNINKKTILNNQAAITNTKRKIILHKNEKPAYAVGIITADKNEEILFSKNNNKRKNKGLAKTNIINGETDSIVNSIVINKYEDDSEDKKNLSSKIDQTDSSLTKKTLLVVTDSPAVKKENTSAVSEKEKKKQKKNSLMIEGGLAVMFPLQQYEQPQYVKRIISNPDLLSEFKSDNIKSEVETGAGLTVNLLKPLNKKWTIGGGIQYVRLTERLHFEGVETVTNFTIVKRLVTDPNGSYLRNDTISSTTKNNTTINGRNVYHIISVPLFIRYRFLSGNKLSCSFTTGVYIDLMRYQNNLPGKFENLYASGKQYSNSKNEIGLDIFAGIHFSGILGKKYNWFAEPGFRYNIFTSKTGNLSFNKMIHKPGINFGIIYLLGK